MRVGVVVSRCAAQVYGNSFKSTVMAVVVPAADVLAAYCLEKGWWPTSKENTQPGTEAFAADFGKVRVRLCARAWLVLGLSCRIAQLTAICLSAPFARARAQYGQIGDESIARRGPRFDIRVHDYS